eukprot:TRINITY_DN729_c1_g1_i1.p1 TRINITY_DN729_c1_g1~~TRINITY_DN729_c1_g1_i1.p1  ORF type:complete len:327 (+),score=38.67 TRINITY_DN729_c1_g1_i1:1-981(+)
MEAGEDALSNETKDEIFTSLLLTIEEDKPSGELFSFLYDLLVEFSFIDQSTKKLSERLDFFDVFFSLLFHCDVSLQVVLLKKLNGLVHVYSRVKGYCCQHNWQHRLINILPQQNPFVLQEMLHLIETIGTFSIFPRETRQLLRLLQTPCLSYHKSQTSNKSGFHYWPAIVQALERMAKHRSSPQSFLDFNGCSSGLHLPSFSTWPLTSGYTFALWLRIESFSDPTSRENYRPCIYSFLTNEGFGVEVFFLQNTLIAQTRQGKSSSKTFVRLNYTFKDKVWYFIAITHLYHFFTTSEITLYVDGKQVDSQQLVYPKFEKAPEYCFSR